MSDKEQTMIVVRVLIPEIRNHIKKISPPASAFFGDEDLDRILEATLSEALDVIADRDSVLVGEFMQALKGSFSFLQESTEKEEQPAEQHTDTTVCADDEEKGEEAPVPAVSLQTSGVNKKKGITHIVVRLKSGLLNSNLFVGVRITGGLNTLVGRRINAGKDTSHPIIVPHGHKLTLRILKTGEFTFPVKVRRRLKAPKVLPPYTIDTEAE